MLLMMGLLATGGRGDNITHPASPVLIRRIINKISHLRIITILYSREHAPILGVVLLLYAWASA